jgi:hypothetical protein
MDPVAAFEDSVLCSGRCFSLVESPKTKKKAKYPPPRTLLSALASLRICQVARNEHYQHRSVCGCPCEDGISICACRYAQAECEEDYEGNDQRKASVRVCDEVQDDDRTGE